MRNIIHWYVNVRKPGPGDGAGSWRRTQVVAAGPGSGGRARSWRWSRVLALDATFNHPLA